MSIFSSFFSIEDEREWIGDLVSDGIGAGVIRDGAPLPEDLDAPYVYLGSHVLPESGSQRGGSVSLAAIPAHVRFWRDHPDAETSAEPGTGYEPFLRVDVHEGRTAPRRELGMGCVLLDVAQAERLVTALQEWLAEVGARA